MVLFQNVTKIYPPDRIVFRDVSISINRGDFILLTGPAGSGKSVFFRLILCEEKPTRGKVVVFGRNTAELHSKEIPFLRRRIGFISQELKLMRPRTVHENLTAILHTTGIFGIQANQKAIDMLNAVGLENMESSYPSALSSSQQQKLMIARALVVQPTILLADEPLSYLGEEDVQSIIKLIVGTKKQGTTIIWASHDNNTKLQTNQRIAELKDGTIFVKEPTGTANLDSPKVDIAKGNPINEN